MAQRKAIVERSRGNDGADIQFFHSHAFAFVAPHVVLQPKIFPLTPMSSSAAVLASFLKGTSSPIIAANKD